MDPENPDSGTNGDNPAWNDFLTDLPEEHHEKVKGHLRNWDNGVQTKLQSVHSQYEPYKQFLDNSVDPQELLMGHGLIRALNEDPAKVLAAIQQTFNLEVEQGTKEPEDDPYEGLPQAVKDKLAKIDDLERGYTSMGQSIQQQRQAELEKVEGEKLAVQMGELRNKHGDFDEEIVLTLMLQGYKPDKAVERYVSLVDSIKSAANRPTPPRLLGGGGSAQIPGNSPVDPRKLGSKDTKNLVAQMLEEAARQRE